jgi:hypothetical protein
MEAKMANQKQIIQGTVLKVKPSGIQVRVSESGEDTWCNYSKFSKSLTADVIATIVIGSDVELTCLPGKSGGFFIDDIKIINGGNNNNEIDMNTNDNVSVDGASTDYVDEHRSYDDVESDNVSVISEIRLLRSELKELKGMFRNDMTDRELFESASRQATNLVNTTIQYLLSYKDDKDVNLKNIIADLKKEAIPAQREIARSIFENMRELPNLIKQWDREKKMTSGQGIGIGR